MQTREVVTLRVGSSAMAPCPRCDEGILLSIEEAMRTACVAARALHRWVEQGLLHSAETPEGQLKICHASLRLLAGRR